MVEKECRLLMACLRLSPLLDLCGGRHCASVSALCAAVAAVAMTLMLSSPSASTTEESASASLSDIVRLLLSVLLSEQKGQDKLRRRVEVS